VLREALFLAADHARRLDPSLAARYHRLMTEAGKHHTSAICHIAPALLTRIIACWRTGERYVLRDVDGRPVDPLEARAIISRRSRCRSRSDHGRPGCTCHQERAAEDRGREAPHRPTRSPVKLSPRGLDTDWELNGPAFVILIEGLLTRFQRTLAELSIRHIRTQIDTPWTNGKAEAF
jgi:hypothetical protein